MTRSSSPTGSPRAEATSTRTAPGWSCPGILSAWAEVSHEGNRSARSSRRGLRMWRSGPRSPRPRDSDGNGRLDAELRARLEGYGHHATSSRPGTPSAKEWAGPPAAPAEAARAPLNLKPGQARRTRPGPAAEQATADLGEQATAELARGIHPGLPPPTAPAGAGGTRPGAPSWSDGGDRRPRCGGRGAPISRPGVASVRTQRASVSVGRRRSPRRVATTVGAARTPTAWASGPGRPGGALDGGSRRRRGRRHRSSQHPPGCGPMRLVVADDSVLLREVVRLRRPASRSSARPGTRRTCSER
jgi:hypothetical protein